MQRLQTGDKMKKIILDGSVTLLTLILCMYIVYINAPYKKFKIVPVPAEVEKPRVELELTKSNVLLEILRHNIKFPLIVYKQAMKESGHLKCNDCSLRLNNIFGFFDTKYLNFNHWTESVIYYKRWQLKRLKSSDTNYYYFLKRCWGAPNMDKYNETLKYIR